MNLSIWIYCIAAIPQLLNNIKIHQYSVLALQSQDIIIVTLDNLINDMHLFSLATGFTENEVFHLGQMLK